MRRGAHLTDRDRGSGKRDEQPLPMVATGIVLGLWFSALVVLALFVVPTLFGTCGGPT